MVIIQGRKDICLRGLFYVVPPISSLIEDKEKQIVFFSGVNRRVYHERAIMRCSGFCGADKSIIKNPARR